MSIIVESERTETEAALKPFFKLGVIKSLDRRIGVILAEAIDSGIKDGLREVSKKDDGLFSLTVARLTGQLREDFEKGVDNILATKNFVIGTSTIKWSEIKAAVEAINDYAQYHFKSRGFYKEPSTENTFPMRFPRFKSVAVPAIIKHIRKNLIASRSKGLVEWSVS